MKKSKQMVKYKHVLDEIEKQEDKIVQLRKKIGAELVGKYFMTTHKTEKTVGRVLGHDCYGDLMYLLFHRDEITSQREKQTARVDEIYFTRESFTKYDSPEIFDGFYNEITETEFTNFVQNNMSEALAQNVKELESDSCE